MTARELGSAVGAAVATLLASLALVPVFSSGAWLPPVAAAVVVVLAAGLLLRAAGPAGWSALAGGRAVPGRLRSLGVAAVPVGQLLLLTCLLTALYAPDRALLGIVPTRNSLAQLAGVLADGTAEMREQATPALALTGLLALTTLFVGLVAVGSDLLAVAGGQAALAGGGLLVLTCVPVMTTSGGIGLVALTAPAIGFALLLWIDQRGRLPARRRPTGALLGTGVLAALRTGGAALVIGIVLGALVPLLREGALTTGLGGGTGDATGTSLDPVAALQGQLALPEAVPLLRLDTDVPDPGYLRAVALDRYDAENGWTLSNLDGEQSIADEDRLAPLPPEQNGRPVRAGIEVLQHDDRFLPLPFSPQSVQIEDSDPDDWRFDPATGTAFGRDVTTGELRYSVLALEPRPSPDVLAAADPLLPVDDEQERFTALPTLPPEVTELVASVTAGATGPYERVRRIHDHLTDRSAGFIYSLATEPGTSGDDLVDFLRLKRGYCEQYAGTMAVMVRAAGVPARVALGYTPGSEERGGTRLITSDDAHAWVEVYFDEVGWMPFDPTPIAAGRAVEWPWAPRTGTSDGPDEILGAPVPSAPSAVVAPRAEVGSEAAPVASSDRETAGVPAALLAGIGATLLLTGALCVPATARALQRRRRIAEGTAGALWDELTASAQDLGVRLRPGRTPRQTAGELVELLSGAPAGAGARGTSGAGASGAGASGAGASGAGAPGAGAPGAGASGAGASGAGAPASDAVYRLARAEEVASYGPDGAAAQRSARPDDALALHAVRRAMERSVSRRSRLLARWWPVSLVSGAGARLSRWSGGRVVALTRVRRAGRTRTT